MKKYLKKFIDFIKEPIDFYFLKKMAVLFLVIAPVCLFIFIYGMTWSPEWQQPGLHTYLGVFSSYAVLPYFYPFLLYTVLSALLFTFSPKKFAHNFIIHLGIYSGTFLAIVLGLAAIFSFSSGGLLLGAMGLGTSLVLFFLLKLFRHYNIGAFIIVLAAIGIVTQGAVVLFIFFSVPFITTISGYILIKKLREYPVHNTPSFKYTSLLTNITVLAGTIFLAIHKTFEEYEKLPKEPPGCYIATAAANGHMVITHSYKLHDPITQQQYIFNDQLVTLKAGELLIKTLMPQFHTWLRRYYNNYGRRLAKKINNPFVADLVYLSLIPATFITKGILAIVFPRYKEFINK